MALIKIICPFCGTKLKVDESQLGATGKCSACRKVFPIRPAEEQPEAPNPQVSDSAGHPCCRVKPSKKASKGGSGRNLLLDFLFFRTMLFPVLVQILSLSLSLVLILAGVFQLIAREYLWGVLLLIAPIFLRLFFEGGMILFSIHRNLQEIRDHLEEQCGNRKG